MSTVGTAWYRHFWPWFIVGLLAISVVASLATVAIAIRYADEEVARPEPRERLDSVPDGG